MIGKAATGHATLFFVDSCLPAVSGATNSRTGSKACSQTSELHAPDERNILTLSVEPADEMAIYNK